MENFEDDLYSINYEKVVACKDFLSTTRLLASNMMVNPYITVGDFLKDITDFDLQILLDGSEDIEKNDIGENFILLTEMLAVGEGLQHATSADELTSRIEQFIVFLTIESLARKKMVKVYHENFSFGEDAGENIIVEKLPDTDE